MSLESYPDAIRTYNKALSLEPNNTEALNYKGIALVRSGQYDKASAVFEKVIQIDPNNVMGWTNKGYVLFKEGNIDAAIKAYDKALSIDPNNADAFYGRIEAIRIMWPHYQY